MKPTDFLEKQHRKVEQIFAKLEEQKGDGAALVLELANDLAGHMAIEQEIFYPAARALDIDTIAESLEEHAIAEFALKRLLHTDTEDELVFQARVKALKELISHHVKEEEEKLFPKVDKALPDDRATEILAAMKPRFQEVVEAGYEAVLPKSAGKASADRKPRRGSVRPPAH